MTLLALGVLLFAAVHFIPSLAPKLKAGVSEKLGENGYKGIFSLLLLAAFALMILGWRQASPVPVYPPPLALHKFALVLMLLAFVSFAVSARASRLRLILRHPQLTGVALWGVAHLLLNGDSRSLLLFGGLAAWALLEMIAINRRDGVWIKGDVPPWSTELVTLLIAAVTIGVVVAIHPWISGVPVRW